MLAYSQFHGLGQDESSGFDLGTFFATSTGWLMLLGGAFVVYYFFLSEGTQERKRQLRTAKREYEERVRGIKRTYKRGRGRIVRPGGGIMKKYKECDIGPSGKVWFRGAWRKPENVEECER